QVLFALLPGPLAAAQRWGERLRGTDWLDAPVAPGANERPSRHAPGGDDGTGPDLGRLCVSDLRATSLPRLLHWADRNGMAHGVGSRLRCPDPRLVEFTVALVDRHNIVGADTKRLLRRALAGVLPDPVARRQDMIGFDTPEQDWLCGPLRN